MWLSGKELEKLTGKVKPSAQKRVLRHAGIDYRERPDGTLIVTLAAVEVSNGTKHRDKEWEPNYDAA